MDFKKELSQIRETLTSEEIAKIDSILKRVEREADSLSTELIEVKREAKEKKIKIRELESSIEEKEAELVNEKSKLSKKADEVKEWKQKAENPEGNTELETELAEAKKTIETLTGFKSEVMNGRRNELKAKVEKYSEHPKWEKAKDFIKLPEAKDGALDWTTLEESDLETNFAKFTEWESLGYFADSEQQPAGFNNMKQPHKSDVNFDDFKTEDDITNYLVDEFAKN